MKALREFYLPFEKDLETAEKKMKNIYDGIMESFEPSLSRAEEEIAARGLDPINDLVIKD